MPPYVRAVNAKRNPGLYYTSPKGRGKKHPASMRSVLWSAIAAWTAQGWARDRALLATIVEMASGVFALSVAEIKQPRSYDDTRQIDAVAKEQARLQQKNGQLLGIYRSLDEARSFAERYIIGWEHHQAQRRARHQAKAVARALRRGSKGAR